MIGLISILFILGLMAVLSIFCKDVSAITFREIAAFTQLRRTVDLLIEEGHRIHVSIGNGGIDNLRGAPGLIGLAVVKQLLSSVGTGDCQRLLQAARETLRYLPRI